MKKFCSLFVTAAMFAMMIMSTLVIGQNKNPRAGRASDSAAPIIQDSNSDRYFVRFRDGVTENNKRAVRALGALVRHEFPELRAIAIKINNPDVLAALQNNPLIEAVEIDPIRHAMGLSTEQLTPTLTNGLYGLITTKATTVHGRGVTGLGINVGIADTSLDYNHPDIAPNYRGGIDTVGVGDNDPINDDGETHGTHVAGTILGAFNNVGVYGVAYQANLYHARVLGPTGGTSSDIMEGVRHLVEVRGCKVVNMSLGGGLPSNTEQNFYNDMRAKGALIVCATGNDGANTVSYPAGYASNVAVGAVDRNNVVASFSNKGTNIDVVAPGVGVLSSVPRGQGFESSVTTSATYTSFGMTYAGTTSGTTGTLVDCALGQVGEFPASVAGNIALIQRGTISFADKVTNAMNAGATAAIIYNNAAGDFSGTLGAATTTDGRAWIPGVTVSDTTGATLKGQAGSSATVTNQASDWDYYDGTSMATPHTTGVLALIWSVNPSFTNTQVESYLFNTCTDLGAAGYDTTYGRGIVNADAAVTQAQGGGGGGGGTAPTAPSNLTATAVSRAQINLSWADNSGDESGFRIERCTGSGCTNFVEIGTVGANVTSTANTGLARNTTYTYRVRAYSATGNSGYS
ncbi:MAG: S8 family serine peptidase, partial [Pyrinomonadaceae bacterium]|nr:S8 family serine peptidase [Pyrinomonadaceae bacterium]